jgi:hypothetical protein
LDAGLLKLRQVSGPAAQAILAAQGPNYYFGGSAEGAANGDPNAMAAQTAENITTTVPAPGEYNGTGVVDTTTGATAGVGEVRAFYVHFYNQLAHQLGL